VSVLAVGGVLAIALTRAGQPVRSVTRARSLPHTTKAGERPLRASHQTHVPRPKVHSTVSLKRVPVVVATATMHVVDPSRTMVVAGKRVARNFEVEVWYPVGPAGRVPLIVFGHGYAVTPTPYAPLLKAWAKAGYVVAAPVFPLENANAPGGPNESDLPNQPADMSLVISSLHSPQSPHASMIAAKTDLHRIAVAGQSDGGDTALAAAYGPQHDPRIGAAVILSGAEDPFAPHFAMPADGPPLLAVQGTADTVNPPPLTYSFFQEASPPKYLLKLLGASHLPPYTEHGHDLTMVEHVTLSFLNRYLKGDEAGLSRYVARRSAGLGSVLIAAP
jgi:fermentation-respiration switch protein FrsA (DUF1100 family)